MIGCIHSDWRIKEIMYDNNNYCSRPCSYTFYNDMGIPVGSLAPSFLNLLGFLRNSTISCTSAFASSICD